MTRADSRKYEPGQIALKSERGRASRTAKVFPIVVPVGIWLLFGIVNFFSGQHFTSDAVAYIECAESISALRGFKVFDWRWDHPNQEMAMTLWPPGYPITIAIVSLLGVSRPLAARLLNFLGFTGALVLFLLMLFKIAPRGIALLLGIAAVCMRSVSVHSTWALSEGEFVFCIFASTLLLLTKSGSHNGTDTLRCFLAGGFAGLAVLFRYAGLSFVAACAVWLLITSFRERRVAPIIAWGIGVALACGWFFVYNYLTFGKFIPYEMPPSQLGIFTNLIHGWQSLNGVYLPLRYAAIRHWLVFLVICAAVAMTVCAAFHKVKEVDGLFRGSGVYTITAREAAIFAVLFVSIYYVEVIVARTKYEWGEIINIRHAVPVAWFGLLALPGLYQLGSKIFREREWLSFVAVTVVTLFCVQLALHAASSTLRSLRFGEESVVVQAVRDMVASGWVESVALADGRSRIYLRLFGDVRVKYAPRLSRQEKVVTWPDIEEAFESGKISCIVVSSLAAEDINAGNYGPVFFDALNRPESLRSWEAKKFGPFVVVKKRQSGQVCIEHNQETERR